MDEMHETWTAALMTPTMRSAADRGETIGELFDRSQERLYRLARRLSRDSEEARDLVQETFLRAARRPGSIPAGHDAQEAWLVTVLVNLCRDRRRRQQVRYRARWDLPSPAPVLPDPETAAIARTTVQRALRRLTARRRAVIVLHELEGLPVARVARLLRMAQVTVRWHLSVGRRELAAVLLREDRPAGRRGRAASSRRTPQARNDR